MRLLQVLQIVFSLIFFVAVYGCYDAVLGDGTQERTTCYIPDGFTCVDLTDMPISQAASYCTGILQGSIDHCPDERILNADDPCYLEVYGFNTVIYFYGDNDSIANQCCPESIKEVR